MDKKVYAIDGDNFDTLDEFYDEISTVLFPGIEWGRNLDALNDVLYGDFGSPPKEPFVLVWKNANRSRELFGYDAQIEFLEVRWMRYGNPEMEKKLIVARQHEGPTLFDVLVEIIHDQPRIDLVFEE